MAGDARQVIVAPAQGETEQIDELLFATSQMPAQAQQSLPMLAKRIETHGYRPAIRPQDLISFKRNRATLTVF
jgi:hypothetical protein